MNSKGKLIKYLSLSNIIQQTDWTSVYTASTVSLAFSEFFKEFDNCICKPYKPTGSHRKRCNKLYLWINAKSVAKVKQKSSIYKECKNNLKMRLSIKVIDVSGMSLGH